MLLIVREALRAIRRTPGTWVMTVLALAISLALTGAVATLALRAREAMTALRQGLTIEAYFDPAVASSAAKDVADSLVRGVPGVRELTFISREEAVSEFSKMSGENVQAILGMNPLPASLRLRITDPTAAHVREVNRRLGAVPGVREIRSDLALITSMESRSHALDLIALAIGGMLVLSALFFSALASRTMLHLRRDAIHTLRLLGATRGVMFGPLYIESGLAGLLGGGLADLILVGLEHLVAPAIGSGVRLEIAEVSRELILASLPLLGLLIGLFGILLARLLRARRH